MNLENRIIDLSNRIYLYNRDVLSQVHVREVMFQESVSSVLCGLVERHEGNIRGWQSIVHEGA